MQRAKTFFYVCAGLFVLALSYQLGVQQAGAQAAGSLSQEVAVLSGQVADGGTIPLPHYDDGSEAAESECRWIVSPRSVVAMDGYVASLRCETEGRLVHVYGCTGGDGTSNDCGSPGYPNPEQRRPASANFLIIATRVTAPVDIQRQTIGQLKARFREPVQPQGR